KVTASHAATTGPFVIAKDPLYVPPGIRPPYCYYPPYCMPDFDPGPDTWRVANLRVELTESTDTLRSTVQGWVNQLVRGQIGEALAEVESRRGITLNIRLDADAVDLINDALSLRSR